MDNRDLLITSVYELPAQDHGLYNRIHIGPEGILRVVVGGTRWLALETNELVIEGRIEYRHAARGLQNVEYTFHDGRPALSHSYKNDRLGGDGGHGGGCISYGIFKVGGKGDTGTTRHGGGGGSSASITLVNQTRIGYDGNPAMGFHGGVARPNGANGGDGGLQSDNCNGGLLVLTVRNRLVCMTGKIQLNGTEGAAGQNGSRWQGLGSSGSGGGAPGGEGGVLVIYANDFAEFADDCSDVRGGVGGAPGNCDGSVNSTSGHPGQPGAAGYVIKRQLIA